MLQYMMYCCNPSICTALKIPLYLGCISPSQAGCVIVTASPLWEGQGRKCSVVSERVGSGVGQPCVGGAGPPLTALSAGSVLPELAN